MAALDDRIREITALSKAQHQALATAAPAPAAGGHTAGMTFPVGTKVLDLVTGETGVVIDGYRSNKVISPAPNQSR